ncbi:hypothetical protein JNW88_23345, partial [Micromonospora sp. ATA32]|nr:hypothetical protein [Micromonospora sp. ATA32]
MLLVRRRARAGMSQGRGTITSVLVAVVPDERGGGVLQPLDPAGRPAAPPEPVADLAAAAVMA